ncbi:MAG TPA: glycosyltransferase family 4 protein [Candidatus Gastranaerophilales bacterium]|nr:glycosyltransferase family 4 protein [Candidatus Gastranaerophilales bacterium]
MKIVYLHNYFHIKTGSGTVMFQEAEIMKQNGHEVYFFCTDKKPYYDENYKYLHYFPKFNDFKKMSKKEKILNLLTPFYNKEAVKKFGMFLDEVKPDLVHEHTISFYLTPAILNECYKRKIPVISTMHGPGYFCPAGNLLNGKTGEICDKVLCKGVNKLPCFINKCYEGNIFRQIYETILRYHYVENFLKKADYFICPSNALRDIALTSGYPQEKVFTVYNCLQEEIKRKEPGNSEYFLYTGRIDKGKGIYNLIEAWRKLPREIPLHIVGTGKEKENAQKIIEQYSLDNVKLLGFKTGEELDREYQNCIATILPPIYFEVFGMTILEAFRYSKPVIGSKTGGIPEVIDDGINGILYKRNDLEALKDAVLKLYHNRQLAEEYGRKGNEKLKAIFSAQEHYNKLIEVYKKAVKNQL